MPAHLLAKNGKVFAERGPIHLARERFVHALICYTRDDALVRR
jgi:hypothetical protein